MWDVGISELQKLITPNSVKATSIKVINCQQNLKHIIIKSISLFDILDLQKVKDS